MPTVRILQGHVLDTLRQLPAESVHCVVTSPPYFGLRAYGTEPQVWGGAVCEHVWGAEQPKPGSEYREGESTSIFAGREDKAEIREAFTKARGKFALDPNSGSLSARTGGSFCQRCGAWRGELGSEPTPELFIRNLVEVFREVRRVLRKDGTFWLNCGDSMAGSGKGYGSNPDPKWQNARCDSNKQRPSKPNGALKPKDLCEIPSLLAIALRDDGWYLRSRIPWIKRSAMPDSTTDRPGQAVEYWFLLSKSGDITYWTHRDLPGVRSQPKPDYRWFDELEQVELDAAPPNWKAEKIIVKGKEKKRYRRFNLWGGHDYFYDSEAVKLAYSPKSIEGDLYTSDGVKDYDGAGVQNPSDVKRRTMDAMKNGTGRNRRNSDWYFDSLRAILDGQSMPMLDEDGNILALPINAQGSGLEHYASFPPSIVMPFVFAGTSEKGVCPTCGAPWARVVEKESYITRPTIGRDTQKHKQEPENSGGLARCGGHVAVDSKTVSWRPTCSCVAAEPVACSVLDPFSGTGTTGIVAAKLGRNYIGLELSRKYVAMSLKRIREECGLLATII